MIDRVIALIFAALMLAVGVKACTLMESHPRLHAGACVQVIREDREPWETTDPVYRIEMVGKRRYLTRRYPENIHKTSLATEWPFDWVEEVACPTKK